MSYFTVIKSIYPSLESEILDCFCSHKEAIEFMTTHVDKNHEQGRWTNIYHETKNTISVYDVGYLGKSLNCKYHILSGSEPKLSATLVPGMNG